jgi:anthranilate synthase component 1
MPDLPPFHGGLVGYLGYDIVREIERLPDVPPDDLGYPDAVLSLTGHVTAFDHFRQRLFLIENVFVVPGASADDAGVAYDHAQARLDASVEELARPLPYVPSAPPPEQMDELPSFTSTMPGGLFRLRSRRREFVPATSSRSSLPNGSTSKATSIRSRCTAAASDQLSPYMCFLAHFEATVVGSSPEAR